MKRYSFLVLMVLMGCARVEQYRSIGVDHHIELWSGGEMIHSWTSSGKVLTELDSDGYYFKDKETGRLVRVSGTLIITPISE